MAWRDCQPVSQRLVVGWFFPIAGLVPLKKNAEGHGSSGAPYPNC